MDPIQGLDWGTYYWFRTQRGLGIAALDWFMSVLNNLGSPLFLGLLAIFVTTALLRRKNTRGAIAFGVSVVAAWGCVLGLRVLVARLRPADAETAGITSFGFPSETAMLSSLIIGMLALVLAGDCRRPRSHVLVHCLAAVAILAIGASQMYLGYNFLTDVLAGWAGGTLLVHLGERRRWYAATWTL